MREFVYFGKSLKSVNRKIKHCIIKTLVNERFQGVRAAQSLMPLHMPYVSFSLLLIRTHFGCFLV